MTDNQKMRVHALLREGLDHEEILDTAEEITGRPIVSLSDLSESESSELLEKIGD